MNRSVKNSKPKRRASSTQSVGRKRSASKSVEIGENWSEILDQINVVSEKVKSIYSAQLSSKNKRKNSPIVSSFCIEERSVSPFQIKATTRHDSVQRQCNSKCHQLMDQCTKLNRLNEELRRQKEFLQKKLYFESKEKRQLRWKLEKDKNYKLYKDIYKYNSTVPELCQKNKHSQSLISCITDQKIEVIPLQNKNINHQKFNPRVNCKTKNSDSLLIDLSQHEEDNRQKQNIGDEKFKISIKSIQLQKQLHELLQRSRLQKNENKKKIIRSQMKVVAQQMRSLKLL